MSYAHSTATYSSGVAITANAPSTSTTLATTYTVTPALPEGLSLNSSTGIISGTPTAITATTEYTITATNALGSATTILTITVKDLATSCTTSGGTVTTTSCCNNSSVQTFPNLCNIGACGCSPDDSVSLSVCECPTDQCFDGTACVERSTYDAGI